ncbi:WxL protein peptidoglycan domain-containing protein [Agrilactobacillus yilanensis]|uniref:WxL protein peptidoglycan domain-containing protein n=1 Tax=Agrilactobacillus yilanensis TaxID=2485997 RepID=A0ABW4J692_9LACO|nr:DUF916 domain-containing protein [Agrilactobacillus yilanensis]
MMRSMRWLPILGLLFLSSLLLDRPQSVNAESVEITPIFPMSQQENSSENWNLVLAPDQTEVIQARLKNNTAETYRVTAKISNPNTRVAGSESLQAAAKLLDQTPTMPSMITGKPKQTLTIKPNATKVLTFTLKMPSTPVVGQIAGKINFKSVLVAQNTELTSQGSEGLELPIIVQNDRNAVTPNLKIKMPFPKTLNNKAGIAIPIANHSGALLEDVQAKITVQERNGTAKTTTQHFSIYPHVISTLWLPKQDLQPGEYKVKVRLSSADYQTDRTTNLTVKRILSSQMKQKQVRQQKRNLHRLLGIGLLGAMVIVVLFFISRYRQTHKRG